MIKNSNIRFYCDGGARGNPGPAAASFVVFESNKLIYKKTIFLGRSTNNVAEYAALLLAMEWLSENFKNMKPDNVYIYMDSQLVVKQMQGVFKIKNARLLEIAIKIKNIENNLMSKFIYINIPREKNSLADSLVNKTLDEN